jgi:hypothetical protein
MCAYTVWRKGEEGVFLCVYVTEAVNGIEIERERERVMGTSIGDPRLSIEPRVREGCVFDGDKYEGLDSLSLSLSLVFGIVRGLNRGGGQVLICDGRERDMT